MQYGKLASDMTISTISIAENKEVDWFHTNSFFGLQRGFLILCSLGILFTLGLSLGVGLGVGLKNKALSESISVVINPKLAPTFTDTFFVNGTTDDQY